MKFSKKQKRALEDVLDHLERAELYLSRGDVVGIAVRTLSPNGASYIIKNPECSPIHAVDVVNKKIGSDLTGLYASRQMLHNLLQEV